MTVVRKSAGDQLVDRRIRGGRFRAIDVFRTANRDGHGVDFASFADSCRHVFS